MKFIIGNWKANKNINEAQKWLDMFSSKNLSVFSHKLDVILCVPYPFITMAREALEDFDHIYIGSQDISQFGAGKYTGAVAAHTLHGLVDYTLVGHSERRKYFNETNAHVDQKAQMAKGDGIEPIVCVRNEKDLVPAGVTFVAYEPVEAIGSGENADIEDVVAMKKKLQITPKQKYIYGGSVTPENVRDYMGHDEIDGVLPGGASLDPETFYDLILNSFTIK